jgi:hypothetical protein
MNTASSVFQGKKIALKHSVLPFLEFAIFPLKSWSTKINQIWQTSVALFPNQATG